MKKLLLKTLCTGGSLSAALMPLVACSQNVQIKEGVNIKSLFFNQMLNLTTNKQLKNKKLWKKFVDVFHDHEDTKTTGPNWRCEFWGKMMRGACLTYAYSQDEELYNILTESVIDMLDRGQDNLGRFSTYEADKEFHSWDVWGRKYVLTAMLHYYEICKDETLKARIITALTKHVDYIVAKIGSGPGQISIVDTGYEAWKSINSSSILEPIVNFYEITRKQKYLDFAEYIINTGGIKGGNIINEARDESKRPSQFSVRKSYETMSFFEGVYRYAKVTNNDDLKNVCINFFEKVYNYETTVVGGAGCYEEQFNDSANSQTIRYKRLGESEPHFGQETCVTVTWMRILNLLYEETGDVKYYDRFSQTALNVFLGALNLYDQKTCDGYLGKDTDPIEGIPFDSYSPLYNDPRGVCTGGLVKFMDQTEVPLYGCCVCIAPAAVGLMGLNYCRAYQNNVYLNEYYDADINVKEDGISMGISGNYLSKGQGWINVNSTSEKHLMLRIPKWAINPEVKVNGVAKTTSVGSYFDAGQLKDIQNVSIDFHPTIIDDFAGEGTNAKKYFRYGPYVLAVDQNNNPQIKDLSWINGSKIKPINFQQVQADQDEFVRFEVPYENTKLIFTNYAAAGRKNYYQSHSNYNLTVFFNTDSKKIPYDYFATKQEGVYNFLNGFNLEYRKLSNMGNYSTLVIPKNVNYVSALSFIPVKDGVEPQDVYDSPEAIKNIDFEAGTQCTNFAQGTSDAKSVNFTDLPNLESVIFPPNYVGNRDMGLFANCNKLATLDFSKVVGSTIDSPNILIGSHIAKIGQAIIKKNAPIKAAVQTIVHQINISEGYDWVLIEKE